jgi:hypothetical protein
MRPALWILLVLAVFSAKAQVTINESICECASYSTLQFLNEYRDIFPPDLMKRNKVKEITVLITPKKRSDVKADTAQLIVRKAIIPEYTEMKFWMNADGLVSKRRWYNRNGIPHSEITYQRDQQKHVTLSTFIYLDSLGNESMFEGRPIQRTYNDFFYDSKGRLVKIKERDWDGKIQPDNKSVYAAYTYDKKDRVIKEVHHYYYDFNAAAESVNESVIEYPDMLSSQTTSTNDGAPWLTETTKYNAAMKPLRNQMFYNGSTQPAKEDTYSYDDKGRLTVHEQKASGIADECPEGANYKDEYFYDDRGLVTTIKHSYKEFTCVIRFEYK